MESSKYLDLQGVKCPLNWARAKAALESMERGAVLELLVDDPRAERDIPRAAEMEGCCVLSISRKGSAVRIVIER